MDIKTFEEMYQMGQKTYANQTRLYLAPLMNYYGPIFRDSVRKLETAAVGIADLLHKDGDDYSLYFLINATSTEKGSDFSEVLSSLSSYSFFVADYPFGEIFKNNLHMLVFKIPEELHGAYDSFITSKYSQMLSAENINKLFTSIYGKTKAVKVMTKDAAYREEFEKRINYICSIDEKSTWISIDEKNELDFLINLEQEVFNYKEPQGD